MINSNTRSDCLNNIFSLGKHCTALKPIRALGTLGNFRLWCISKSHALSCSKPESKKIGQKDHQYRESVLAHHQFYYRCVSVLIFFALRILQHLCIKPVFSKLCKPNPFYMWGTDFNIFLLKFLKLECFNNQSHFVL